MLHKKTVKNMNNSNTCMRTSRQFDFMISIIRNLNNSLILSCEHEHENNGIQDKVTNVYSKLFIIVNTLLQGDDYSVPPLPNTEGQSDEWNLQNFLALGLAMNFVLMNEMNSCFEPRKMCERCYDDALNYWKLEADQRGIDLNVERRYVPVPYFNERNELVMMFKNAVVIKEEE